MLENFVDDWEALLEESPERTIGWKRRLAYCLQDATNLGQSEILLTLIDRNRNVIVVFY